jgi:hypothetical protein
MLCDTFEHLRIDPAFVLSEINRVLAPGAALVLTTPNVYSLPSLGRFLLGRSIADPLTEFGKLRNLGHMGMSASILRARSHVSWKPLGSPCSGSITVTMRMCGAGRGRCCASRIDWRQGGFDAKSSS